MYKILIIEDDQIIAKALKNHLDKWELETQIVEDFHHILDQFVTYDPPTGSFGHLFAIF